MDIVTILMERDGITESEAKDLIRETKEEMLLSCSDEILMENLGLEPDYVMDVLLFDEM